MKIVSNFKDYYDYLQGVRGIDELVTYERIYQVRYNGAWFKPGIRKPSLITHRHSAQLFRICMCGKVYMALWIKYKFYFFREDVTPDVYDRLDHYDKALVGSLPFRYPTPVQTSHYLKEIKELASLNEKYDCPILLAEWEGNHWDVQKNIKLEDYGLASILSAEEIWNDIYNFISQPKTVTDNRSDTLKLEAAGFDKKTSFRKV